MRQPRVGPALLGLALSVTLLGCQPLRRDIYEGATPIPTLARGEVVLTLGRRYAVVASGLGLPLRETPGPTARLVGTLQFAVVASTSADTNGTDGKVWRRIDDRGWAPRDGLLVFDSLRDATALAIELRIFSPPALRASLAGEPTPHPPPTIPPSPAASASPRPTTSPTLTVTPTRTPSATPSPSPTSTRPAGTQPASSLPRPLYAVVVRPDAYALERPGQTPAERAPRPMGTAQVAIEDAIGPDGQRYVRLEDETWMLAADVAIYATLTETTNAAYRAAMAGVAPGIEVDTRAAPALWLIRREPDFRYLADTVRSEKIPVRVAYLDPGTIAQYSFSERTIAIGQRYVDADVRLLAVALTHELTHAWEQSQGFVLRPGAPCFEAELRAFQNQAALWTRFHGPKGKEKPNGEAEIEQNDLVRLLTEDPEALKARLVVSYRGQCRYTGRLPPVSTELAGTPGPGTPAAGQPATKPAAPPTAAASAATPIEKAPPRVAVTAAPASPRPGGPVKPSQASP